MLYYINFKILNINNHANHNPRRLEPRLDLSVHTNTDNYFIIISYTWNLGGSKSSITMAYPLSLVVPDKSKHYSLISEIIAKKHDVNFFCQQYINGQHWAVLLPILGKCTSKVSLAYAEKSSEQINGMSGAWRMVSVLPFPPLREQVLTQGFYALDPNSIPHYRSVVNHKDSKTLYDAMRKTRRFLPNYDDKPVLPDHAVPYSKNSIQRSLEVNCFSNPIGSHVDKKYIRTKEQIDDLDKTYIVFQAYMFPVNQIPFKWVKIKPKP